MIGAFDPIRVEPDWWALQTGRCGIRHRRLNPPCLDGEAGIKRTERVDAVGAGEADILTALNQAFLASWPTPVRKPPCHRVAASPRTVVRVTPSVELDCNPAVVSNLGQSIHDVGEVKRSGAQWNKATLVRIDVLQVDVRDPRAVAPDDASRVIAG